MPHGAEPSRPQSAMSNASARSMESVSSTASNSSVVLQLQQSGAQMPPLIYKKPKTQASVKREEREAQRQAVRQELGIGASSLDEGASDLGAEAAPQTSMIVLPIT